MLDDVPGDCQTQAATFGLGGECIADLAEAVKDDGLLALTLIRNLPRWKVVFYTPRLYSGGVAEIPEAHLFKTKKINVESLGSPIFCETDGEFIGPTPTEISIFQHQLSILVP